MNGKNVIPTADSGANVILCETTDSSWMNVQIHFTQFPKGRTIGSVILSSDGFNLQIVKIAVTYISI